MLVELTFETSTSFIPTSSSRPALFPRSADGPYVLHHTVITTISFRFGQHEKGVVHGRVSLVRTSAEPASRTSNDIHIRHSVARFNVNT